jgi:hypothetical protein
MEITDMSIGNLLLGSATFTQSEIHFEIAFTYHLATGICNSNLCQANELLPNSSPPGSNRLANPLAEVSMCRWVAYAGPEIYLEDLVFTKSTL